MVVFVVGCEDDLIRRCSLRRVRPFVLRRLLSALSWLQRLFLILAYAYARSSLLEIFFFRRLLSGFLFLRGTDIVSKLLSLPTLALEEGRAGIANDISSSESLARSNGHVDPGKPSIIQETVVVWFLNFIQFFSEKRVGLLCEASY